MFEEIKKELYFKKLNILYQKGLKDGRITLFDDDFYDQLSKTYVSCLPVSIHIKYLKPIVPPGKCFDRSLYMFFCFDNAYLVRGDNKDLALRYGIDGATHGWIEIDNYVYDPSSLLRYDKKLYYEMFKPTNISKCNKDEYCMDDSCRKLYEDIKKTTILDFRPNGKKRMDLVMMIPLIEGIAKESGNQEFIDVLNDYLNTILYDEKTINKELEDAMDEVIKALHHKKLDNI